MFIGSLRTLGVDKSVVKTMVQENPAELFGLASKEGQEEQTRKEVKEIWRTTVLPKVSRSSRQN